jgi:hypothetical protein
MDMKASKYDLIRTLVEVQSDFGRDRIMPVGSEGTVVECYTDPVEGYAVDIMIPDDSLVGGFDYENVILLPDQFEVVRRYDHSESDPSTEP